MSCDSQNKWVIRHDNGSYFERMTGIGPKFTSSLKDAMRFDTDVEACYTTLHHWAFAETQVEQLKG